MRHFLQGLLRKSAYGNKIDPAAETAGAIRWSLARAESDFRQAQKNCAPAQLDHPRLERDTRAQARLFKDHGHTVTRQQRVGNAFFLLSLELGSQPEDFLHLFAVELTEIQQIAFGHNPTRRFSLVYWRASTF